MTSQFIPGNDVKEIKRVVEKLPGFDAQQPNTTNIAEADSTTQPEAMPLKEKLLDPTTMQEITKHAKTISKLEFGVCLYHMPCLFLGKVLKTGHSREAFIFPSSGILFLSNFYLFHNTTPSLFHT